MADEPKQQSLPPGYCLEEYEIRRELGSGGFGITYVAWDLNLEREVVIKENLPVFAFRDTATSTVHPRSQQGEDAEMFAWSMTSFIKEARTLAKFDHPNIVRVLRVFEANGTAYFVMPKVDGRTLSDVFQERFKARKPMTESELRAILVPMLGALEKLHDLQVYHRDIKPANILLQDDGRAVLIDFGAARQRISQRSLTVVESPGYTPFEQLQSRGNVGPWSDFYGLAATLYKGITGESPPKANDRVKADPIRCLARDYANSYSQEFLKVIDQALNFDEEHRPQSAVEWLNALEKPSTPFVEQKTSAPPAVNRSLNPGSEHDYLPTPTPKSNKLVASIASIAVLAIGIAIWALLTRTSGKLEVREIIREVPTIVHLPTSAPETKPKQKAAPLEELPIVNAPPTAINQGPMNPSASGPPRHSLATPADATKEVPFQNGLGMKFVPVPIGTGPSKGQRVLFSIWETRSKDYATFIADKNRGYQPNGGDADEWRTSSYGNVPVGRGENELAELSSHPVQRVNWEDATAYCEWLTKTERSSGNIGARDNYRLPTDIEWSYAAGIGDREDGRASPEQRFKTAAPNIYPWGTAFPPPANSGNYADITARSKGTSVSIIEGYNDGYATTSPVGSFAANQLGLYDIGGNAWEWCQDSYNNDEMLRVLRGASWANSTESNALSALRVPYTSTFRLQFNGFRCVLIVDGK